MEDVLRDCEKFAHGPHVPQIRIYLLSAERPPVTDLFRALVEYDPVPARSEGEVVFIRRIAVDGEEQYRLECERVAKILAPKTPADSSLSCVYDDAQGKSRFQLEFQKTGGSQDFVRIEAPSDPDR